MQTQATHNKKQSVPRMRDVERKPKWKQEILNIDRKYTILYTFLCDFKTFDGTLTSTLLTHTLNHRTVCVCVAVVGCVKYRNLHISMSNENILLAFHGQLMCFSESNSPGSKAENAQIQHSKPIIYTKCECVLAIQIFIFSYFGWHSINVLNWWF